MFHQFPPINNSKHLIDKTFHLLATHFYRSDSVMGWITPSSICRILHILLSLIQELLIIIHSKYFPDSDLLKAHAQFTITSF